VNASLGRKPQARVAARLGADRRRHAALLDFIDRRLSRARRVIALDVDLTDGGAIAWLYRTGEVLERRDDEQMAHLTVGLDAQRAGTFRNGVILTEPLAAMDLGRFIFPYRHRERSEAIQAIPRYSRASGPGLPHRCASLSDEECTSIYNHQIHKAG